MYQYCSVECPPAVLTQAYSSYCNTYSAYFAVRIVTQIPVKLYTD